MCRIEQVSLLDGDPPTQAYHFSYSQIELHPSPSAVLWSSHSEKPMLIPSPQISLHVSLFEADPPLQVKPVSTVHPLDQPSPLRRFPSSQPKLANRLPSPQISDHTEMAPRVASEQL
jgi:hypothetical protein